jgi:DNA-binding response OmpR family regulator
MENKDTDTVLQLKRPSNTEKNFSKDAPPVILIVEDVHDLAELLALRLKMAHFSPVIAHNGNLACQMSIEIIPDLILLDITLPEMNGWEVCRFIRSHHSHRVADIPIIMLSALYSQDNKYKGHGVGADDFLPKPINFENLFHKMKVLLQLRQI